MSRASTRIFIMPKVLNKLVTSVLLSCAFSILAGCAAITPPKEKPVIEDKVGESFGILSVTAERRAIVFGISKKPEGSNIPVRQIICAEPSPDVAESLASSFKAIAEIAAKKGDADAKAGFELGKSLATAISSLFVRTQGIQFMRDGTYALCQAYLNHMIDEKQFAKEYTRVTDLAYKLIEKEIPSADTKRAEAAAIRAEAANANAQKEAAGAKAAQDEAAASAVKAQTAASDAKGTASKTTKDATK